MERSSKLQLHADLFSRIQLIIQQIELRFWYLVIPQMRESTLIWLLIQGYILVSDQTLQSFSKKGVLSICLGVLSGLSIGLVLRMIIA
jgi:hypothetical protein